MDLFGRKETKYVKKMAKRVAHTTDVYRFENLGALAWDVWNSPPNWPAMDAALGRFLDEAEDIFATIQRPPIQAAVQGLVNAVNNAARAATQSRWSHHPIGGWMPDPRDEFAKTDFPIDSACGRLLDAANQHLNPQRNEDNEHMFRKQWRWQDHNGYY
jgi:hypothetical protein